MAENTFLKLKRVKKNNNSFDGVNFGVFFFFQIKPKKLFPLNLGYWFFSILLMHAVCVKNLCLLSFHT